MNNFLSNYTQGIFQKGSFIDISKNSCFPITKSLPSLDFITILGSEILFYFFIPSTSP